MACSRADTLPCFFFFFFLLLLLLLLQQLAAAQATVRQSSGHGVSALFTFGDSTVDPGNNNYLPTPFKSNFPPYGIDFDGHRPTGRFTNGKLTTDFIASYLGLKEEVPAYLNPNLGAEDIITGVSFASAGSGFDSLTAQATGAIPITEQVNLFEEYIARLQNIVGKERSEYIIRQALFIISGGANDFIVNYFALPFRFQMFSVQEYLDFLMDEIQKFLQVLSNSGAQRIAVAGIPPLGCVPIVVTLHGAHGVHERDCITAYNSIATGYNNKLQKLLKKMSNSSTLIRFAYLDIYKPVLDQVSSPKKYGIEEWRRGCCGTGLLETSFLCNPGSPICHDASKYLFWDSVHPTEKSYFVVFNYLRQTIDKLVRVPGN